jgi:hypothetical protein
VLVPLLLFLIVFLPLKRLSWSPLDRTLVGFVMSSLGTGSDRTWPAAHWLIDAGSEFKIRPARPLLCVCIRIAGVGMSVPLLSCGDTVVPGAAEQTPPKDVSAVQFQVKYCSEIYL